MWRVHYLNSPYGSNELNKPLTDRYNAGVLDNPRPVVKFSEKKSMLENFRANVLKVIWSTSCPGPSDIQMIQDGRMHAGLLRLLYYVEISF